MSDRLVRCPNGGFRRLPSFKEAFRRGVSVGGPDECWLWQRSCTTKGYGHFKFNSRLYQAHRVALELAGFPCPGEGYGALHGDTCVSPACCNPHHLRWGTNAENLADRMRLGRSAKGERNGFSKLTEEQARTIKGHQGSLNELAATYGIALITAQQIRSGHSWKHLK